MPIVFKGLLRLGPVLGLSIIACSGPPPSEKATRQNVLATAQPAAVSPSLSLQTNGPTKELEVAIPSAVCAADQVACQSLPGQPAPLPSERPTAATPSPLPSAILARTTAANVSGIRIYEAPPRDVIEHAETVSQDTLTEYGLPPRPDRASAPLAYESWLQSVTGGLPAQPTTYAYAYQTPWLGGHDGSYPLVRHGAGSSSYEEVEAHPLTTPVPIIPIFVTTNIRHDARQPSPNWSGIDIYEPNGKPFKKAFIQGTFTVPRATCSFGQSGVLYASAWVGIDGWGSSTDVLQAGTDFTINCSRPSTAQTYAWTEWYPADSKKVTNFPVSANDSVTIEVWTTGDGVGRAHIVDNTSHKQIPAIAFNPPPGTKLVGDNVEWIVERPEVGGNYSDFANYGTLSMVGRACIPSGNGPCSINLYPGSTPLGQLLNIYLTTTNSERAISSAAVPDATGGFAPPDMIQFTALP